MKHQSMDAGRPASAPLGAARRARASHRARLLGVGWLLSLLAACAPPSPVSVPPAGAGPAEPAASAPPPDRSALPAPGPRAAWSPPAPESWKLPGGADVLFAKHGAVPLVSLALILPSGDAVDPPGKEGLTAMMGDMLDEGAGGRSALELGAALQALATDYGVSVDVDSITLRMNMIADNLDESLALLADIVRRPQLSEAEFERRKAQRMADAISGEANPQVGFGVALRQALFGSGYGGHLSGGTRDTLAGLTLDDVKGHYQAAIAASGASFVVAGGVEKEAVAAALQRHFGDWSGEPAAKRRPVAPAPARRSLYIVDYPGAAQSVMGVVRRAPGAGAEDLVRAEVFNRAFGGQFTSRINMNLREDKGYTYGASSFFRRHREAGFFLIVGSVRTDVTRASIDEVMKELEQVGSTRPITEQEWRRTIGGELLGYPNGFEQIGSVARRFGDIPRLGRPLDWFERWPARVEAVTLPQTNQVASTYGKPGDYDVVISGDEAKVLPTLEGVELAVVKLDPRGRPR